MERLPVAVTCVLVAVLTMYGRVEGVNYVVALMGHNLLLETNVEYEFLFTNTYNGEVTISAKGIGEQVLGNVTISAQGGKAKLTPSFTQMQALNGSEIANKSIIVSSVPENAAFTLQVFVRRTDIPYVEGFMGIPVENLAGPNPTSGYYEYIVTTFCATGGYCQFAIAAYNQTAGISITFPEKAESIVFCIDNTYFRSNRDTSISLEPYHAVQFETTSDLTGTHIYSKQPIVVFVGSYNVTYNQSIAAHTVEQLPPSSHWGKNYAVRTLGTNGYGDILKISSNWGNTEVTMKGFPTFVIKNTNHTVTRRLGKDMDSFITASHPIQVVQITGLPYGNDNELMKLGMTVVPAIEHFQASFTVSCGGDEGDFRLVSEKLQKTKTKVDASSYDNEEGIEYTKYTTGSITKTADTFTVTNSGGVGGILKCDSTVVMPLGTFHANIQPTSSSTSSAGMCKEGQRATTTYTAGLSTKLVPHMVSLTSTDDILKLRVQNCGQAVVQFNEKSDAIDNSIVINLSRKKISVTQCYPTCNVSSRYDDPYNNGATLDCTMDMSFYWFRQFSFSGETKVCLGVGPFPDKTDDCIESTTITKVTIPNRFVRVSMMGLYSTASFNYDLQPNGGCSSYNQDSWRCIDNISTCASYGTQMCNDATYAGFVDANCRKYCGKCTVDSFGNNFRVLIPAYITSFVCSFYVTAVGDHAGIVAVGTKSNVIKAEQHGATRSYSCVANSGPCESYVILADASVSVTVVFSSGKKINSFPVYPIDAFGTEFMAFGNTKVNHCCFLAEDGDVQVTPYYTHKEGTAPPSQESQPFTVTSSLSIKQKTGSTGLQGALFVADGLFTVFCGLQFLNAPGYNNHFNQMLPLQSMGTQYMVPAFSPSTVARPFDAKLMMLARTDNTIISIDGDFTATLPIYLRGRTVEQPISASAVYNITSNYPIAVGLNLYDPVDTTISSFHVLPSTTSFTNQYILEVVPSRVLSTHAFDVMTNGITAYSVVPDGTSENTTVTCTSQCSLRKNTSATGQYSMAVILGEGNKWMVMPGQTGSVPYVDTTPCVTSDVVVADGIDNDCDKLKDEDVCYKGYGVYAEDFDLDGDFGDDCVREETANSIVEKPQEAECLVINKTDGYCWAKCYCKCSWKRNLDEYMAMSDEEKAETTQINILRYQLILQIETKNLTSATSQKKSAADKRQSSANIGYVGIGLFAVVIGTIFVMDFGSLFRDVLATISNIREGFGRLGRCIGKGCK